MKLISCIAFLASSALFAQSNLMVVGTFPHYAVGAEWSTTIYLDVDGQGTNFAKQELSTCNYRLDFYNTNGLVKYSHSFSKSSDYSFRTNLIKFIVPDFNFGVLAYGPVLLSTDCSESYPVKAGELIFSQNLGNGKVNDGTVAIQAYQRNTSGMMDTEKFGYGYAVYNPSTNARAIFVTVYSDKTKTVIVSNRLLLTLAGKEQKIFMMHDLVPELKVPGLYATELSDSPYESLYTAPLYLMLKFNLTGLFSTGLMYTTYF